MRMESVTKKSLAIFLMGCGISGLSVIPAQAQWGWNPFSSQPQTQSQEQQEKPSFFRSPFEVKSPTNSGESRAATSGQSTSNSARPISDTTRRAIVETSRKYPIQQRQAYIKSFAGLTDQQARERLQQYSSARSRLSSTPQTAQIQQSAHTTARPQVANTNRQDVHIHQYPSSQSRSLGQGHPWSRSNAENQRPESRAIPTSNGRSSNSPGVRMMSSSSASASQNPFLRSQQGLSLQGNASVDGQGPTPRPFPKSVHHRNEEQSRNTSTPQPGVASTGSGIRITPADANQKQQLPMIRPASNTVDTSHYQRQYQPQKSEVVPSSRTTFAKAVKYSPASVEQVTPRQSPSANAMEGPELSQLISRAESLAASSVPGPSAEAKQQHITRHVDLRLLYLLAGQRDRALRGIPGIEPNEQAFWTRTLWALSNYMDHPNYPNKSDRTTVALEQLRSAIHALQGDANLVIRNAVFCSDIESFGTYTRFEQEEFKPGQEILIYSELDNFKSEQTPDAQYRTVLKSAVRLVEAGQNGREVDRVEYNTTEDLCHSHRTDFMQGYKYRLPDGVSPGAYVLQLVVEDQLSGKRADYSLNLQVR